MAALIALLLAGTLLICVFALVVLPGGKWLGLMIANRRLATEFVRLKQHEFGIESRIQARQEYFILQERIYLVVRYALAAITGVLLVLEMVFGLWFGGNRPPRFPYALLHSAFFLAVAGFLYSAVAHWVFRFELVYFLEFSVTGRLDPPDGLRALPIRIRKPGEQRHRWWTRG